MPHDRNGNLLSEGDGVSVEGKVKSILVQEDYCNITIELPPMPPYTDPYYLTLNAKQVLKLFTEEGSAQSSRT